MAKYINVLMCGGRRTGKTSIMAAMQANMRSRFNTGNILLLEDKDGYGQTGEDTAVKNRLDLYKSDQEQIFSEENYDQDFYYADNEPTLNPDEYLWKVVLQKNTGIRGEWKAAGRSKKTDVRSERKATSGSYRAKRRIF